MLEKKRYVKEYGRLNAHRTDGELNDESRKIMRDVLSSQANKNRVQIVSEKYNKMMRSSRKAMTPEDDPDFLNNIYSKELPKIKASYKKANPTEYSRLARTKDGFANDKNFSRYAKSMIYETKTYDKYANQWKKEHPEETKASKNFDKDFDDYYRTSEKITNEILGSAGSVTVGHSYNTMSDDMRQYIDELIEKNYASRV